MMDPHSPPDAPTLNEETREPQGAFRGPEQGQLTDQDRRQVLLDPEMVAGLHHPGGLAALKEAARQSDAERRRLEEKDAREEKELEAVRSRVYDLTDEVRRLDEKITEHRGSVLAKAFAMVGFRTPRENRLLNEREACSEALVSAQEKRTELSQRPFWPHRDVPSYEQHLEESLNKVLSSKLAPHEVRELLTPEFVSTLSLEDFVAVWRRLDPAFLSHVTRHGVRDHVAMIYHSAGVGEYHDSLRAILRDGNFMRPPIAASYGLVDRTPESMSRFVERFVLAAEDREEAMRRVEILFHQGLASAPPYPDKLAVHFAADTVADDYYGAETGNCPFYVIPSALIASRYPFAFNGWEKTFARQSEKKWNDVFVWAGDGVPMELGILFLPKSVLVDPETGSRYKLSPKEDSPRKVVQDQQLVARFSEWCATLNGDADLTEALKAVFSSYGKMEVSRDALQRAHKLVEESLLGIGVPADAAAPLSAKIVQGCQHSEVFGYPGEALPSYWCEGLTSDFSLHYVRAEVVVTAETFWRRFFEQHPEQEPRRVVFYDGDPTDAVLSFQIDNRIATSTEWGFGLWSSRSGGTRKLEDPLLGFADNYVEDMRNDPRANQGREELERLAMEAVDARFGRVSVYRE